MAGFLGWLRWDGGQADVAAALACLRHHPSFQTQVLAGDGRQGVGAVYRPGDPPEVFELPERGLLVGIWGAVVEYRSGQWHRYSARELAHRYLERGLPAVSGLDGAYQVVIRDEPAGRLHFFNDRIGSLYMQHARTEGGVAFAPEAKALFRLLPLKPRLDFAGMMGFLNLGHPIGTSTLFEGVRLLAPAHRWTLDLRTGAVEQARTWVQRFEPDQRLTLRAAADQLYQALLAVHQAPLGREDERPVLALTGGYDSRLVLGLLQQVGRLPTEALTWGATDQVPGSDVTVAREVAALAGVPHRFLRYAAERVPTQARAWCVVSELASDNLGFYAAGPGFLEENAVAAEAVLLGEHVIGVSGLPRTVDEAIETVTRLPRSGLLPALAGVLTPEGRAQVGGLLWRELEFLAAECTGGRPKEVQDHLYLQVDTFRWLCAPAFYKEPMRTPRRPLYLDPVLAVTARLPESLRVDKRVVVRVLERHLSTYLKPPLMEADSLPDWNYDSRHAASFRAFLESRTRNDALTALPWEGTLDLDAARKLVNDFFQANPPPLERRPESARQWVRWRARLMGVPVVGAVLQRLQPALRRWKSPRVQAATRPLRLITRLAQLRLLQECIEAGEFAGPSRLV